MLPYLALIEKNIPARPIFPVVIIGVKLDHQSELTDQTGPKKKSNYGLSIFGWVSGGQMLLTIKAQLEWVSLVYVGFELRVANHHISYGLIQSG